MGRIGDRTGSQKRLGIDAFKVVVLQTSMVLRATEGSTRHTSSNMSAFGVETGARTVCSKEGGQVVPEALQSSQTAHAQEGNDEVQLGRHRHASLADGALGNAKGGGSSRSGNTAVDESRKQTADRVERYQAS